MNMIFLKNIFTGNFVFRAKSRRLCAPPFCTKDLSDAVSTNECSLQCEPVDTKKAKDICQEKLPVMAENLNLNI